MRSTLVFTEIVGCGEIAAPSIESFIRFHSEPISVYGLYEDFKYVQHLLRPDDDWVIIDEATRQKYKSGHAGTAAVFTQAIWDEIIKDKYSSIVHFDSDVIFKFPCLIDLWNDRDRVGIAGSRRCYKNNPVNIPVPDSIPDAISTYFFMLRSYNVGPELVKKCGTRDRFERMCLGAESLDGHIVLDFFDPVTRCILSSGYSAYYTDSDLFGGQDEMGSKKSRFPSNMHLDMGRYLAHFGGVASGLSYLKNPEGKNESYGNWALGRLSLFAELFNVPADIFHKLEKKRTPTQYDENGRWINGFPDKSIILQVIKDMQTY